eukprot:3189202-Amphidinium_carterae.1
MTTGVATGQAERPHKGGGTGASKHKHAPHTGRRHATIPQAILAKIELTGAKHSVQDNNTVDGVVYGK